MDYGDQADGILVILLGASIGTCFLSILLTAFFPCSCKPKRDCRRNCSDCARDRQRCRQKWYDCCVKRARADTEEELIAV